MVEVETVSIFHVLPDWQFLGWYSQFPRSVHTRIPDDSTVHQSPEDIGSTRLNLLKTLLCIGAQVDHFFAKFLGHIRDILLVGSHRPELIAHAAQLLLEFAWEQAADMQAGYVIDMEDDLRDQVNLLSQGFALDWTHHVHVGQVEQYRLSCQHSLLCLLLLGVLFLLPLLHELLELPLIHVTRHGLDLVLLSLSPLPVSLPLLLRVVKVGLQLFQLLVELLPSGLIAVVLGPLVTLELFHALFEDADEGVVVWGVQHRSNFSFIIGRKGGKGGSVCLNGCQTAYNNYISGCCRTSTCSNRTVSISSSSFHRTTTPATPFSATNPPISTKKFQQLPPSCLFLPRTTTTSNYFHP